MHPALVPAALVLATSVAMGIYVLSRSEKRELHWLFAGVLAALAVWVAGTLVRFSTESPQTLHAALRLMFLGVFTVPPLWLMLALRYDRGESAPPAGTMAALLAPSAVAWLALLTNEGHGLVMREVSFAALEAGPVRWAGPLFWVVLVWCYLCVLAGSAVYLRAARRMAAPEERRRRVLLAVAAAIPVLSSFVYLFRILPVSFDLTPSGIGVALVLLYALVFRYQMLETLPLARRDVIEHHRDGIVVASADGFILDVNPAAARIFRKAPRALRGRPIAHALAELAGGHAPGSFPMERCPSKTEDPLVAELRTADHRVLEVTAACVRHDGEAPAGYFAVLRDRTEERRFERLVRQSQKLESVGALVAGVAHEVNNPLAFIRSNLAQIQRMGEIAEEYREREGPDAKLAEELAELRVVADEARDGIERIAAIVAEMRHFSGPPDEAYGVVDLNAVVEDAVRLANLRGAPAPALALHTTPQLPAALGSPQRLVRAVLNLLINAAHALDRRPDGRIDVETRVEGDRVALVVRDNGPGIPDEIQERIFDPFFTTKDPQRGTGLGLAIALDILLDHDGTLEVQSRSGEGACFTARLPCAPREHRAHI